MEAPAQVSASNRRALGLFTLTLFFLSGAFALVYQVAWVRAMTLEFGSTTLAVSTVLTVFMGGLGLGAWLIGRRIDRAQMALATYGALELVLAAYTLCTPLLIRHLMPWFSQLLIGWADSFLMLSLVRFVAAVMLLGPPTILMGATLPVLSRFWALRSEDAGRWAGLLYGINTVGAFAGTLAAGFYLLPGIGLSRTLYLVAFCNVLLGLVALGRGWYLEREATDGAAAEDPATNKPVPALTARQALPMHVAVLLTGFAALVCEVAWTRTLVLVLGPSTYAFTIVLATFLAGLGLGAAFMAAVLRGRPEHSRIVFYVFALLAAIAVTVSSSLFSRLPTTFLRLYHDWNLEYRYDRVLLVQVLLSAAVMALPAFIMGGLFPAAARALVAMRQHAGQSVGRLYAWNTAGTIAGSFTAGFLLIPLLGIRGALLTAISAQVVGGVVAILGMGPRTWTAVFTMAGAALLVLLLLSAPPWNRQLMVSAFYHYAESFSGAEDAHAELVAREEMLFYRDGLTATVTVNRNRLSPEDIYIATNGKVDGSSRIDMPTQRLIAHFPLLLHPNAKQVAVIGMGTGCTAGSAALHPVEKVTVVEIEKAMVEGAKLFAEHNHRVHENPRVDIRVTDGRLFLHHRPEAFDVIISEPSNPWLAGVSDLFTQEFFRMGARSLREGGIFGQWVQLYGLSPESLQIIVRTFNSVFPEVYLASTLAGSDVLLIGSMTPIDWNAAKLQQRIAMPLILQDIADERVGVATVEELLARIRMGPKELRSFAAEGQLHTDDLPVIAYRAPLDLYRTTAAENQLLMWKHANGIAPYLNFEGLAPAQRRTLLLGLADAYDAFLLGQSSDARHARELAEAQQ